MSTINSVMVTGRATSDPKICTNKDGSRKIFLQVAVKDSYKGKDGKYGTQFVPVEAFIPASKDKNGVFDYINKGDLIAVSAEVRNNNYTDKDGNDVYGIVFVVTSVDLLESKGTKAKRAAKNAEQADVAA